MKIPSTIEKISDSGFDTESLTEICEKSVSTPESFNLHPRLTKYFIEPRLRSKESSKFDWATAETMCFGSLMKQGFNIRLSGQDVGRGTFSQRHCMLVDQKSGITFEPLNNMGYNNQGFIEIANSHLSEFAVLGFEVGVSWENPNRLCIWEAQFGDFFNVFLIDLGCSSDH